MNNNYKYKAQENKYEIKGNVVEITIVNKKDKEFIAKIDLEDMDKVKALGTWFAEWQKDFNNYLAQNINETKRNKKGKPLKQNLQGVILGINGRAPIKHINGDFLDNRRENLEILDSHVANDYELLEDRAEIILKDKYGVEEARAIVSKEDIEMLIKEEYNWVVYKKYGALDVVANTTEGRIYLEDLLMSPTEEQIVYHINLNPLDNRRENLELQENE